MQKTWPTIFLSVDTRPRPLTPRRRRHRYRDRRGELARHAELHGWTHARCLRPKRLGTPNLLASGASRRLTNEEEALAPRRPTATLLAYVPTAAAAGGLSIYGMAPSTAPILIAACLQIHDIVTIADGLQMPLSRQRPYYVGRVQRRLWRLGSTDP